ncbi:phage tail sheath family protein [Chryseobacterium hispalense]|uniref:phage tail sheath family protein n=1 Tax=Chryseobacterium hispalense TaxID=1453492 RepID=UPI00391B6B18
MQNPATPGVSVEEITRLPNSVSLIDTTIPVFIGYTELIPADHTEPLNISSLLEYEKYFGKAKKESIRLKDTEGGVKIIAPEVQFLMYYSLQMYFANGGGPCQIVSAGNYTSTVEQAELIAGFEMIQDFDEPRIILFPDAVSLSESDLYTVYNQVIHKIEHVAENWFLLLDTCYGNSTALSNNLNTIGNLRNNVSLTTHAAAYFPHLTTVLNYAFDETDTPILHIGLQEEGQTSASFYAGEIAALDELKNLAIDEIVNGSADPLVLADLLAQAVAIVEEINETADETSGETDNAKDNLIHAIEEAKAVLEAIYDGTIDDFDSDADTPVFSEEFNALKTAILAVKDEVGAANGKILKNVESSNSMLYNQIKKEIASLKVVLPPSSAMAGVYGRIDSTRGVWKAPANISLNYVVAPTEKVSDKEQADMNVNNAGSVNAIRTFTGKGTLVWGARTLDAKEKTEDDEDNIWKYINVRRYYDMIKLSIKRALINGKFINQPNIPHTWLRAKTMIENFLNQQWMDGGLSGSTPKEAYHVEVSGDKDKTMNITIKIALVRPAEFIVINFSHKLQ